MQSIYQFKILTRNLPDILHGAPFYGHILKFSTHPAAKGKKIPHMTHTRLIPADAHDVYKVDFDHTDKCEDSGEYMPQLKDDIL